MIHKKLTGTGVAIVTPFRNDGSIDFKSLGKLLEHIINGNADYIVVLGTTGESVTLSKDEKRALVSFTIEYASGKKPVIVGVGGNNTQDVVNSIGLFEYDSIDAVLSVSPYYNKPSQEGLFQHFKAISQSSPVPLILYNVPGRTGSNMCASTTVRLAKEFDNIIAVKEASGNLNQIMEIIKNKPDDFLVISGDDALTLPMISLGASGAISVIANAFPSEFSSMVRSALNGDYQEAKKYQYLLFDMITALFEEGSPSGIKAVLSILRLIQNNLRLPLTPVSEKHYKKLQGLTKLLK